MRWPTRDCWSSRIPRLGAFRRRGLSRFLWTGWARRIDGCRRYPPEVLRTLAIIGAAQRAGLTLEEIRLLLASSPGDPAATRHLRQVAERKLPEVRALIERAEIVRRWLDAAAGCTCPSLDDCSLFDEPARLPPVRRSPEPVRADMALTAVSVPATA